MAPCPVSGHLNRRNPHHKSHQFTEAVSLLVSALIVWEGGRNAEKSAVVWLYVSESDFSERELDEDGDCHFGADDGVNSLSLHRVLKGV